MDRETLFQYFEQNYISKSAVLPWLPLGMNPNTVWAELQKRRKAKCIMLPIHGSGGEPCWYVITDRMIAASERVVEEFMNYQPPLEPVPLAPPEENYYTSLLEGMEMSVEDGLQFILSNNQPNGEDEQKLHNNRYGIAFAEMNLFHPLDNRFIQTLAEIVSANLEKGGGEYRSTDNMQVESMGSEKYTLPPARLIPDYIREITAFLSDPGIHPMIKAGIVQAWVLMVRPFAVGNERLARLLSLVVLHRAGYTFFSDVSFSNLIATNGYAYYEAVNSLLRSENDGDMTYFLDYFLQLLAHAANEHGRKSKDKAAETLMAERQMAGTVLAPVDVGTDQEDEEIPEMDITDFTFLGSGDPYTEEKAVSVAIPEASGEENNWQQKGGEWVGASRIRERLERPFNSRSKEYKDLLLKYLNIGKFTFSSKEVVEILGKNPGTVTAFFRKLSEEGVLQILREKPGIPMVYSFCRETGQYAESDYSEEFMDMLRSLSQNTRSSRDSRIGRALLKCTQYGFITIETYQEFNEEEKWQPDMEFAQQIGLVKQVDESCCLILKYIHYQYDQLNPNQRKKATEMYNSFGDELFSQKMVIATLSYSENTAKAVLHEFRLLRILDCQKDGINFYKFRVNPRENPECFDEPAA